MKAQQKYRTGGFTLIELLIVVGIIAILSAIAVPQMLKVVDQAKDKRVMSEMRNIALAIGMYNIKYEMVPNTSDISVLINTLKLVPGNENLAVDTQDTWGNDFYYDNDNLQDEYTLKSWGKGGIPSQPASPEIFDAKADVIIVTGVFVASHEGVTAVVGR
jgi:general secretion pathway protein G